MLGYLARAHGCVAPARVVSRAPAPTDLGLPVNVGGAGARGGGLRPLGILATHDRLV
jgi:hypothetical protein